MGPGESMNEWSNMVLTHLDAEEDHDTDWDAYYESCDYCEDNQIPTMDGPICAVCNNPVIKYQSNS